MYAKIDINLDISTWSETKLRAYFRIASIANFQTGRFWYTLQSLADKFECSRRYAKMLMREFESDGVVIAASRPGSTTLYLYPIALAGKPEAEQEALLEKFQQLIPPADHAGELFDLEGGTLGLPQGGTPGLPPGGNPGPPPQDLQQDNYGQITTTRAIKFDPYLIAKLIRKYGREAVQTRVVVISALNGKVTSPTGLLIDSLENDYIPTAPKEVRDKQARREREEAAEKRRQEKRQEREKMQDQLERERNDPEVQARIQAEIAKANAILGITKPNIHAETPAHELSQVPA